MIKKVFYVILIMILLPEKIFQLIGAFLCGYSFGYYMVEHLRYKNKKEEIEELFSNCNKYYGSRYRSAFRKDARNESN